MVQTNGSSKHHRFDLMAIDPSTRGHGIACFIGKKLVYASYVRPHLLQPFAIRNSSKELIIEVPQKYGPTGPSASSLIQLSFAAGFAAGMLLFEDLVQIYPRQWTGRIKKEERIPRVIEAITEEERLSMSMPTESLRHNVWDAVGIGLFRLGRANW